MKRWERWPLVEEGDRGLAQSYLKGRLEVAVELKISPDADHTAVMIIRANKVVNKNGSIYNGIEGNPSYIKKGADDPMFFNIAELIKVNQKWVPSDVRLYFINNKVKEGFGDLDFVLSEGVYRSISRVPNGEVNLLGGFVFDAKGSGKSVIERTSGIYDAIAEDKKKSVVERLFVKAYYYIASLNIRINKNQISFLRNVDEGIGKVHNVMLCASKF